MGKAGGLFVNLGINTGQFTKGIRGARKELTGFQKIGAGLKSTFSPANLGFGAMAAGTALIGAAIGDAIETFKEFEKANSELKAVLGGTDKEMAALSDQAKELGSVTAFTASEVTSLQTSLAKLGFNSKEIDNMTASTLAAAAALGSDLGEQATLTGATLSSFRLDSTRASEVNDVLALSASKSALDFGKLSAALPIVGAVANATGMTLQRTTAILGTLSNNGMDASSSATALRNILIKLSAKGMTWEQAMTKINTSTDKTKTSFDLFGKTSAAAGVILAGQSVELNVLTEQLKKADGAAQDMADTMLDNVAGDTTKAGSAWEGFTLALTTGGNAFSDTIRGIIQGATDVLTTLTKLISGATSTSDMFKIAFNTIAKGVNKVMSPLNGLLKMLDKATGTNFSKIQVEIPRLELESEKLAEFDKVLKKQNASLFKGASIVSRLSKKYQELGLTEAEAIAKAREMVKAMRPVKKIMPEVADGLEDAEIETVKLTKAQKDLAKAMRDVLNESDEPEDDGENIDDFIIDDSKYENSLESALSGIEIDVPVLVELEIDPEQAKKNLKKEKFRALGAEAGEALSAGLQEAAAAGLSGLGEAIGNSSGVDGAKNAILGSLAGLMDSFGKQLIVMGIGMEAFKVALKTLNPAVAIGGGIALIAAASAIKSSMSEGATGFAAGGLVTGSVFANVGEGRGTTKSNPEVIAPLDKLQNMIAGSGGGMSGGEVIFRIGGQELVGILNRQKKVNKFS